MKNLKVELPLEKITDEIIFDDEKRNAVINYLITNNEIKECPFGFEYNGITELVIELEIIQNYIGHDIVPIARFENEQGFIIQEPSDEVKYLLKISNLNYYWLSDMEGMNYYISVIKLAKTNSNEKLNMISYLLANINKKYFKVSNIYLNRKDDVSQIDEEEIQVISKNDNYLLIANDDDFIFALTYENGKGMGKYMAVYQLLENKMMRNDIRIENLYEKLSDEIKKMVDSVL